MAKTCPICEVEGHGYTQCPRPLLVPAVPQREGETELAYHKRLRFNEYMRLWTQRKEASDPTFRRRTLDRASARAQMSPDSPAKVRQRRINDKRQAEINAIKGRPCMDCMQTFPVVCMQFDHRPDEAKLFGIGGGRRRQPSQVLAEIAKCDVVCANCHAIRTNERARTSLKPREPEYVRPPKMHKLAIPGPCQ